MVTIFQLNSEWSLKSANTDVSLYNDVFSGGVEKPDWKDI